MAFKYKPYKNKFSQESKILDELHNETLIKFDTINKQIYKIKKKIISLNNKILNNNDNNYSEQQINDIKNNINFLENKIIMIQNNNDELEYYEKTKDILVQYYENSSIINDKIPDEIIIDDHITDTKSSITDVFCNDNNDNINLKSLKDDFLHEEKIDNFCSDNNNDDEIMTRFNLLNNMMNKERKSKGQTKKKKLRPNNETKSILSFLSVDNSGNKITEPITQVIHEKGTLKDIYLSLTDTSYVCDKVKMSPIKNCKNCNNELTLMQSEGYFVCQNCSEAEYTIIESEIPSHKDAMNEKPKYPYNPINHLIEKLNQYQAKQTTIIPGNIYELVKNELKKRMISCDDVSPELVQKILKKYRKDIYYEHHFLIFSYITNTPPPSLTREEEEDIKKMFKLTEKPFKLFKPDSRENYLNYSYVLNKLFLIKAQIDNNPKMVINAKYFKLLKSRDKLRIQDTIWKQICNYLDWPFHPSF